MFDLHDCDFGGTSGEAGPQKRFVENPSFCKKKGTPRKKNRRNSNYTKPNKRCR